MIRSILLTLTLCVTAQAQNFNHLIDPTQLTEYAFTRDVSVQKMDPSGKVLAEYRKRSEFVFDDQGKQVERVIYKTPSLKGISEKDVEAFALTRKLEPLPGVRMMAHYYNFRKFGAEVIIKDSWGAHLPKGQVNVYLSHEFSPAERQTLFQAMQTWNALVPEIKFVYAGAAWHTQLCVSCITVARNIDLKNNGTFQPAERDGIVVYGRIELGKTDLSTLFTVFTHELGHTLGLDHQDKGLMKEKLIKGKMVLPSGEDVQRVKAILLE